MTATAYKLGDIVNVRGFAKGDDRAHVVVDLAQPGRLGVCYCGHERWWARKTYAIEFITPAVDNAHSRRAARWVARAKPGPDGWTRIAIGWKTHGTETIGAPNW